MKKKRSANSSASDPKPWLFKPGQSGNPDGRPKVAAEVRELARQYGPEAIERLVQLMRGDDAGVAARAADAILDRGYGKPAQEFNISSELERVSREELRLFMLEALAIEGVLPRGGTVQ